MLATRRMVVLDNLPFVPMSIPGCACWLSADRLGLNDNDAVGSWPDLSGNGRTPTQGTAGNKPTYKAAGVNGKPSVYFVTDDVLVWADVFSAFTGAEIFVVIQRDADPPIAGALGFWWFGSAGSEPHVPFSDGTIYDNFGATVRKTTVNPTPSLASPRIYNVMSTASLWTSRLDGALLHSTTTNTVGLHSACQIGKSYTTYFAGHFAELILYNRGLTPAERKRVHDGLGRKYSISVTT